MVGGLSALLGPVLSYFWPRELELTPSEPVRLGVPDSIAIGDSRKIRFGRYPALVIHSEQKGLVAYSAVCTHFACIVKWNPDSGMIECPCHAGFYDPLDGSVISGPPPRPLEKIALSDAGGTIVLLPAD
jgi:cytochrome b6-f complex iron-sulfur subunit